MTFDFSVITSHMSDILSGFGTTLVATAISCLFGMGLGLIVALGLTAKSRIFRYPVRLYVEVIRTTPFLIQLFLLYYGGPSIGLYLEPLQAGIIGLAIYGSAYYAEIFRAGFQSIPKGHLEVAQMMGFSHVQMIWRIQIPQMMVLIVPALVNTSIILGKETAVLSIVTVPELTFVLTGIGSETYAYAETLLVLSIAYLIMAEATSRLGLRAEKRLSKYMER
ncbi:amino acid ABC transporter permease [Vibrio sp.]|uniref:Amino acid ABC transporter permease n=1 Tax=Vibrio viridaestus TaxID=2487322 RepID=A0A3N9THJ2_9VIBR|nr:amino acid ABC transporter permease [Vibrio viridaestus]MDC0609607.1 amino acid ABC transporter permease [Vibrio sp.]RQW63323.1 amino acid ABC transporter permease [Vibrio viridaestus]